MATLTTSRSNPPAIAKMVTQALNFLIPPVVCTGVALGIWEAICRGRQDLLPAPSLVIAQTTSTILEGFDEGGIWWQLFESLKRVGIGYSLAAVLGIMLGVAIGVNKFLRQGTDPMVQILRTVPPLAWLPLSLAVFKDSRPAALFLIFITAIWPILINTAVGVQQIPKDYNNVAKVLRLSGKEYFFSILIPSTVPYIFTGLRIGVGLAWLAIVAAEMLASGADGIGAFIWNEYSAKLDDSLSKIILAVFCVGVVGLILDRIVGWLGSLVVSE
ncbi:nitrate ABC transporter permease [Alkalinema sp. FACHB-956]|uniref:nitrate ABC transporter permease n=1 Tax=Alkalinema sp. FACHB-956 TaxID=2692768 RepID=UPI001687D108|nr:nitrate ABC transporter permease [Alkalinema sp. FACHB-956]MBD2328201.1 nitrate ABC transporter permease [Alkalinema sp. FACHB-956]